MCTENKDADQHRSYFEADLRLWFFHNAVCWFSHEAAQLSISPHLYVCICKKNFSQNVAHFLSGCATRTDNFR